MNPAGAQAAEWVGYQLATHPRLRRVLTLWAIGHVLALWAVTAAPPAAASTMAGALNWTGITDSRGVPLGAYYLSVVSTREAITEAGPDLSANPTSWVRWLGNAVSQTIAHDTIANWLQAQASVYVFMVTLALWLLRFAMSSTWLYWLATWFRPLFEVLQRLLIDLYVFPICLAAGLAVGAHHVVFHNRRGRGWGIVVTTFVIGVVGMVLTHDPLTELHSDHGLLTQGRNLGFTVAQAAMNNGGIATGGAQGQLSTLTGLIADATVRMPMQLWNFGAPIDGVGGCADAYSAALLTGEPAAPAHAMGACGAPAAMAHAQQLDGSNFALGVFFCLLGAIFTFFICYVAYSYIMVAGAAFLNAILALFAAGPAMVHGAPRRRALRRLKEFFRHAVLVFAYVTYISFAAVVVLKTATPGGYATQVQMTHPVAVLVLVALISAVATGLFVWLKRELGDHTRRDLTHAISEAIHHGRDGYHRGRRGYERGRDQWDRTRNRLGRNDTDDDAADGDPDRPLTGEPAAGRPPGGRPHRPGRGGAPKTPVLAGLDQPPKDSLRSGGAAAGRAAAGARPAAGGAATTAAEAGATVVAPEVVAGVAVAAEVKKRLPKHHARGASQPAASNKANRRQYDEHRIGDDSSRDVDAAPGRSATTGVMAQQRRDDPAREEIDRHPHLKNEPPFDDPPATGRHH